LHEYKPGHIPGLKETLTKKKSFETLKGLREEIGIELKWSGLTGIGYTILKGALSNFGLSERDLIHIFILNVSP
jgi:hypothetical protein